MPQKFPFHFREEKKAEENPNSASSGLFLAPPFIKDPQNYIIIPQHEVVLAKRETLHGFDFTTTLEQIKTIDSRLFMPPIHYFTRHFFNVYEASQGNRELYDGIGNPLPKSEVDNLWQYFTSKNREQFGEEGKDRLCWTWLNAKFIKGTGFNNSDMQTFNIPNYPSIQPLEQCFWQHTYVILNNSKFNKQGIPIQDIQTQDNYSEGNNLGFWYPRENSVAVFVADSDRAILNCYGYPSYRDDALGVFTCAKGIARAKISRFTHITNLDGFKIKDFDILGGKS